MNTQRRYIGRITPDMNDGKHVFVFGSNLAGRHGMGAALEARKHWGALPRQGEGLRGHSFAIATKDERLNTRTLPLIQADVAWFLRWAARADYDFLVTPIGTGLAGHKHEDIAPMFKDAPPNVVLPEVWRALLEDKP